MRIFLAMNFPFSEEFKRFKQFEPFKPFNHRSSLADENPCRPKRMEQVETN